MNVPGPAWTHTTNYDKHNIQWQPMTAYLFEPSAHQAVRYAHEDLLNGHQHHAFVPSDETNPVEDCDKTIPSGTQVVVRPRFPRVSFSSSHHPTLLLRNVSIAPLCAIRSAVHLRLYRGRDVTELGWIFESAENNQGQH